MCGVSAIVALGYAWRGEVEIFRSRRVLLAKRRNVSGLGDELSVRRRLILVDVVYLFVYYWISRV